MRRCVDHGRLDGLRVSSLWLFAATCYFVLAAATIHLTSDGSTIATVWPANAVLVALLCLGIKPRWLTVLSAGLMGNLAANWVTRSTVSGPLLYSLANGLEVIVAVQLMRVKIGSLARLQSTGNLMRFFVAAGLVAPLVSGLVGGGTAWLIYSQPFEKSVATWILSDSLGLLVFTPVLISVFSGELSQGFISAGLARRLEILTLLVVTIIFSWLVFFIAVLPAVFVLYAPVMLVTFRMGPSGTKMAVMIIAVIGASATGVGVGPIAMVTNDPEAQAHLFQASLAIMMLTCLPVAAEIEERNRLVAELAEAQRKAAQEASTDALTGVLNRRGFERAVHTLLREEGTGLYCVAIDIDRFKPINDQWGHQFGDGVIRHVSTILKLITRPGDLIGRLGGDEFVLVMRVDASQSIDTTCDRLQAALRASPIFAEDRTRVVVGVSCGAAAVQPGDLFDDVYRKADRALYTAKGAGRNTYRLFTPA